MPRSSACVHAHRAGALEPDLDLWPRDPGPAVLRNAAGVDEGGVALEPLLIICTSALVPPKVPAFSIVVVPWKKYRAAGGPVGGAAAHGSEGVAPHHILLRDVEHAARGDRGPRRSPCGWSPASPRCRSRSGVLAPIAPLRWDRLELDPRAGCYRARPVGLQSVELPTVPAPAATAVAPAPTVLARQRPEGQPTAARPPPCRCSGTLTCIVVSDPGPAVLRNVPS